LAVAREEDYLTQSKSVLLARAKKEGHKSPGLPASAFASNGTTTRRS
jgi:hypothetical protein